ncbi:hypothetical protein BDB01DRAFT_909868 [Pilobolus umbonatus]|nr:hypothetical protein BDB01DRAFT_909868 [Pilobolus umbonatus]
MALSKTQKLRNRVAAMDRQYAELSRMMSLHIEDCLLPQCEFCKVKSEQMAYEECEYSLSGYHRIHSGMLKSDARRTNVAMDALTHLMSYMKDTFE